MYIRGRTLTIPRPNPIGIPLLPDAQTISRFLQGEIGIADSFNQALLQKQLSAITDPTSRQQFESNFQNRPSGTGINSLERVALKSKFDTLFPVIQLVMILLQMLKTVEDSLCRVFMRNNPARFWWALNYKQLNLRLNSLDMAELPRFPEVESLDEIRDELGKLLNQLSDRSDRDTAPEVQDRLQQLRECALCDIKALDDRIEELECQRKETIDSFAPPSFDPSLEDLVFDPDEFEDTFYDQQTVYLGYFDNEGNRVDPPNWIKQSKKWVSGVSDSLDVLDPQDPGVRDKIISSLLGPDATRSDKSLVDSVFEFISQGRQDVQFGDYVQQQKDKLKESLGLNQREIEELEQCCIKDIEKRIQQDTLTGLDLGGREQDVEVFRGSTELLDNDDREALNIDANVDQALSEAFPRRDSGERIRQTYAQNSTGQIDPDASGGSAYFDDDDGNVISSGDNITMMLDAIRNTAQLKRQAGIIILMDRFVRRFIDHRRRERERLRAGLLPGGVVPPVLPPFIAKKDEDLPFIPKPDISDLNRLIQDRTYQLKQVLPESLVKSIESATARSQQLSFLPPMLRDLVMSNILNRVYRMLESYFNLPEQALNDLEALHPYDTRRGVDENNNPVQSVQLLPFKLTRGSLDAVQTPDGSLMEPETNYAYRTIKVSNDPGDPLYNFNNAADASRNNSDVLFTNDNIGVNGAQGRDLWTFNNFFLIGNQISQSRTYSLSFFNRIGTNRYVFEIDTARRINDVSTFISDRANYVFLTNPDNNQVTPYKIESKLVTPYQVVIGQGINQTTVTYHRQTVTVTGDRSIPVDNGRMIPSFEFLDVTSQRLDPNTEYLLFSNSQRSLFSYSRSSNSYYRSNTDLFPDDPNRWIIRRPGDRSWLIVKNPKDSDPSNFISRTGVLFNQSFFDNYGNLSLRLGNRQVSIDDPFTEVRVKRNGRTYVLQDGDSLRNITTGRSVSRSSQEKEDYSSVIPKVLRPGLDVRYVQYMSEADRGQPLFERYKTFWLIEGHYSPDLADAADDDAASDDSGSYSRSERYRSGSGSRNPSRYKLRHVPSGIRKFSRQFLKIAIKSFLPTIQRLLEIIKDPTKIGEMIGFIVQQRLRQDFVFFDTERMYNDVDLSYNYTYFDEGFRKTVNNEVISTVIDGVATVTVPGLFTFGFKIEQGLLTFIFTRDKRECKFDSSIIQLILSIITLPVKLLIGIIKAFVRLIKGLMSISKAPSTLAWFLSFKWLFCLIDPWNLVALFGLKFKIPPFGLPGLGERYTSQRLDPDYFPFSDPILGDCAKESREGEARFQQSVDTIARTIETIQETPDELLGFYDSDLISGVSPIGSDELAKLEKLACGCENEGYLDRINQQVVESFRRGTGQLDYQAIGLAAIKKACREECVGSSLDETFQNGIDRLIEDCPRKADQPGEVGQLTPAGLAELLLGVDLEDDREGDEQDDVCARPEVFNAVASANISYGIPFTFPFPKIQFPFDGIGSNLSPGDLKPGQDAAVDLDNAFGDSGEVSVPDLMGLLFNFKVRPGTNVRDNVSDRELEQMLRALKQLQPQQFAATTVDALRNMSYAAILAKLLPKMIDLNDFIRMPVFFKGLPKYTPEEFKQLIFLPLEFVVGILQLIEDTINGLIVFVFAIFGLDGLFPLPRLNLVCKIPKFVFEEDSWKIKRVDRCPSVDPSDQDMRGGSESWSQEELDSIRTGRGFSSPSHGLESTLLRTAEMLADDPELAELCGCDKDTIGRLLDVNLPDIAQPPGAEPFVDFSQGFNPPDFPYTT